MRRSALINNPEHNLPMNAQAPFGRIVRSNIHEYPPSVPFATMEPPQRMHYGPPSTNTRAQQYPLQTAYVAADPYTQQERIFLTRNIVPDTQVARQVRHFHPRTQYVTAYPANRFQTQEDHWQSAERFYETATNWGGNQTDRALHQQMSMEDQHLQDWRARVRARKGAQGKDQPQSCQSNPQGKRTQRDVNQEPRPSHEPPRQVPYMTVQGHTDTDVQMPNQAQPHFKRDQSVKGCSKDTAVPKCTRRKGPTPKPMQHQAEGLTSKATSIRETIDPSPVSKYADKHKQGKNPKACPKIRQPKR